MAWNLMPIGPATQLHSHAWLIQFWEACRKRSWALGQELWPDYALQWHEGVIGSISHNGDGTYTLTDADDTKVWDSSAANPWIGDTTEPAAPSAWDVLIHDTDYTKVVRASVLSIADPDPWKLQISDVRDYVTTGQIPSVASLDGRRYYILARLSGTAKIGMEGLFWSDRWLQWPNAPSYAAGTLSSATTGSISHADEEWTPDAFVGKEVMVKGDDGRLHRLTITGNTIDTIAFGSQSFTPTGKYAVIDAGGRWRADAPAVLPYQWYTGSGNAYYSLTPLDTNGGSYVARDSVSYMSGREGVAPSLETVLNLQDLDYFTDAFETEEASRKSFNPYLPRCFRGLQAWLEGTCTSFVEKKSYDGLGAIPNFTPATWWKKANVNWTQGTTGTADGDGSGITFSGGTFPPEVDYPYGPVHYTILDTTGAVMASGATATLTSATKLEDIGFTAQHEGKTIIIALGWTRYHELRVRRMYPLGWFVPDTDPLGQVIHPPLLYDFATSGTLGVGAWSRRQAPTKYAEYAEEGRIGDTGADFTSGDLARYVGDNHDDPTTDVPTDPLDPTADWAVRAYEGRHTEANEEVLDEQRFGTATGGTNFYLEDAGKNWYSNWYGGGVLRTESGSASSGTTTSLTDNTKTDSNEAGAFWTIGRFLGFSGPFVGFVIEVETSPGVWEPRVITSATVGTSAVTATWSQPLSASSVGKRYRIREPDSTLNRYEGRTLRITKPDGSSFDRTITANDATRIYFTPTLTIDVGDTYQIVELEVGGVYRRSASSWVAPTGDDVPRLGASVPAPFRPGLRENLPTIVRQFGRIRAGDILSGSEGPLHEIYKGINALVWTKHPMGWTSRANDAVAELNEKRVNGGHEHNHPDLLPDTEAAYDAATPIENISTPPYAYAGIDEDGDLDFADLLRAFAYGVVTGIPTLMPCTCTFMVYGAINDVNEDAGGGFDPVHGIWVMKSFFDHGDPVQYRKWTSFHSDTSSNADRKSSKFGSLTRPEWPPFPAEGPPFPNHESKGYHVFDDTCILKWDVAGGMEPYVE